MVEHYLDMVGVTGSNPVPRTIFNEASFKSSIASEDESIQIESEEEALLETRNDSLRMIRLSLTLLVACLLSSCSTAFQLEWKAATALGPQSGIEGAWQGTWLSSANGHHGNLRCIVGHKKNAQGDREFHYHATWAGLVGGAYRATHRVNVSKGASTFTGEYQMPRWAGGRYVYGGTIQGDAFNACYECSKDKGTFQMQRVR